jgi:hypothetical protein
MNGHRWGQTPFFAQSAKNGCLSPNFPYGCLSPNFVPGCLSPGKYTDKV